MDMSEEIEADFGCKVEQRQVSIHELINSDKEDRLLSMFGVSTHTPLLPINRVCYRDTTMMLNTERGTEFNDKLNMKLVEKMNGDPSHPWITAME